LAYFLAGSGYDGLSSQRIRRKCGRALRADEQPSSRPTGVARVRPSLAAPASSMLRCGARTNGRPLPRPVHLAPDRSGSPRRRRRRCRGDRARAPAQRGEEVGTLARESRARSLIAGTILHVPFGQPTCGREVEALTPSRAWPRRGVQAAGRRRKAPLLHAIFESRLMEAPPARRAGASASPRVPAQHALVRNGGELFLVGRNSRASQIRGAAAAPRPWGIKNTFGSQPRSRPSPAGSLPLLSSPRVSAPPLARHYNSAHPSCNKPLRQVPRPRIRPYKPGDVGRADADRSTGSS